MFGEVSVHLSCIIVLLAILTDHWLKFLQISFAKIVEFHFYAIEECFCLFLDSL